MAHDRAAIRQHSSLRNGSNNKLQGIQQISVRSAENVGNFIEQTAMGMVRIERAGGMATNRKLFSSGFAVLVVVLLLRASGHGQACPAPNWTTGPTVWAAEDSIKVVQGNQPDEQPADYPGRC